MAWLTLADATGAIEAAVLPNAYAHLGEAIQGESPLRASSSSTLPLPLPPVRSRAQPAGPRCAAATSTLCVLLANRESRHPWTL
jgi:hypothetical protein